MGGHAGEAIIGIETEYLGKRILFTELSELPLLLSEF
jgi:hypothetical protein